MNLTEVLAQDAGEPYATVPHLSEIILATIAFAVLAYIVAKYLWPTMVASHDSDVKRLREGMERAETEYADAQSDLDRSRARLAEVDHEAARIRDDARADAERIKSDLAENAREESERIVAQGHQTVDASRARTVSELRSEVGAGSVELARRLVAESLSDDAARGRSVDDFLDRLDAMSSRADDAGTSSNGTSSNGTSSNGVGASS